MNKVLLFNPRSAKTKPRIPNSILAIAAAIQEDYPYAIVDGNMEQDPWIRIEQFLSSGQFKYFALTCMPGPQLQQAIPYSKRSENCSPHQDHMGRIFSF
jgi:hypothetical protein